MRLRLLLIFAIVMASLPLEAAKPKKKSVDALLKQYNEYYGVGLNVSGAQAGKSMLSIPDYASIFNEEYPDFINRNTSEALRLENAAARLDHIRSSSGTRAAIQGCDSLLAGNHMLSPFTSNRKIDVQIYTTVDGENADGQKVTLYGDKKNNLVAVLESKSEDGSSSVLGDYENIDLPYYGNQYKEYALAFSKVNRGLRSLSEKRDDYISLLQQEEQMARQEQLRAEAQAAALLERQIKSFKPDRAVAQASKFLASKGHSVSSSKNIENHGARKVMVYRSDFAGFMSNRIAAETKMPTLRRTLAQTKEAGRYSTANRETLKKNVRTLLSQNNETVRMYRAAKNDKLQKDIIVVTYSAGLVGKVTLYCNPDGSLNFLTWKDSSGQLHTEYPALEATFKTFDELSSIVEALSKFN